MLKSALMEASAYVAKVPTASEELWHRRFGHVYLRTLKKMKSNGKVSGISCNDRPQNDVQYVPCTEVKQVRLSLSGKTNNPTGPGEVFSDVCGPLPVESLGRKRYLITFSDGYSSFKEV